MKGYYLRRWASETLKFSSKHIELVQQHSKRENLLNIWLESVRLFNGSILSKTEINKY